MPNPGGGNQFGNYTLQPGYGDVKKQTQLTKSAPISGSPFAAQALNTPRRAKQAATRKPQAPPPAPLPGTAPQPQGQPPSVYRAIAGIPGLSPVLQQVFANG